MAFNAGGICPCARYDLHPLPQLFDLAKSVQWLGEAGAKRKVRVGPGDSEDKVEAEAPSNDIYRKKMHKKIK